MKTFKTIAFVAVAGATLFAATAGAEGSANQGNAQSSITSTTVTNQSIPPEKLNLGSGEVVGFLGESKILFVKANPDATAVDPKSKKKYNPLNIYVKDLGTGKETLLAGYSSSVGSMGNVIVSPDQKYVFFTDDRGYNILNLSTGKAVNVVKNVNFITTSAGSWSDNTHFVYFNTDGNIFTVDVNGKIETLYKTGKKQLGLPSVIGSTIYYPYTAADNSVVYASYNMKTKETTNFKDAYTVNPAPNGSQLAMVKDGVLVLTDLKGNVKTTLAQGESYPIWSQDGSKFAYTIYSTKADGSYTGTYYIYDVKTGKQYQLNVDKNTILSSVHVSPSGKSITYQTVDRGTLIASVN